MIAISAPTTGVSDDSHGLWVICIFIVMLKMERNTWTFYTNRLFSVSSPSVKWHEKSYCIDSHHQNDVLESWSRDGAHVI